MDNSDVMTFYKTAKRYFYQQEKQEIDMIRGKTFSRIVDTINTGDIVLDLGCGGGVLISEIFKRKTVVAIGVDLSFNGLLLGKSRCANVNFIAGSTYLLPFSNDSINKILCWGMLEHIEDPIKAINEILRVLKPGGTVILRVPQWLSTPPGRFVNLNVGYVFHMSMVLILYYFLFKLNKTPIIMKIPYMVDDMRLWESDKCPEMFDYDACSWSFGLSLVKYLEDRKMVVEEYNTYQALREIIKQRRNCWQKTLAGIIFKLFNRIPVVKHLGSVAYIEAFKPRQNG